VINNFVTWNTKNATPASRVALQPGRSNGQIHSFSANLALFIGLWTLVRYFRERRGTITASQDSSVGEIKVCSHRRVAARGISLPGHFPPCGTVVIQGGNSARAVRSTFQGISFQTLALLSIYLRGRQEAFIIFATPYPNYEDRSVQTIPGTQAFDVGQTSTARAAPFLNRLRITADRVNQQRAQLRTTSI